MTTPLRHALPTVPALALALAVSAALAAPAAPPAAPAATVTPAAATAAAPASVPATPDAALPAELAARVATDLAAMREANPLAVRDDAAVAAAVNGSVDGARSLVLDESFRSTIVVRLGADGQPVFGCVDSRDAYDAFFAPTPADRLAPTAPEVR